MFQVVRGIHSKTGVSCPNSVPSSRDKEEYYLDLERNIYHIFNVSLTHLLNISKTAKCN